MNHEVFFLHWKVGHTNVFQNNQPLTLEPFTNLKFRKYFHGM
jgi:hypothetical protein